MSQAIRIGMAFLFLLAACAPSTTATPAPADISTPAPTAGAVVVENPPQCAGANMVFHTQLHEILLVGCTPSSVSSDVTSVIWGWNGTQWHRVAEGGPQPLLLSGAAYDEDRNVVVQYGGFSLRQNKCERETWEWDGLVWSQKQIESPGPCDHVEMVYDGSRDQVILFGGGDENQNLNTEIWSWDGTQWASVGHPGPPGRAHFGFVYDGTHEQILLYGGYSSAILDDFWAWQDSEWQPLNFPGPGPRSHFGMALDRDGLLLFGGASSTSTFSSLSDQTWRLTDGTWSELPLEDHPSSRGSPTMGYDPERDRIVLYGGFASDRSELNDTWEWDGERWECILNCR